MDRADCIVLLGAKVRPDGTPSDTLSLRCAAALAAWESGVAPVIVACGARGPDEPTTEAAAARAWLAGKGVPEGAILAEEASASTLQNLQNAKIIMEERGLRTAAVCTSGYHLPRALRLARDIGLDATGIAAASPRRADVWLKNRLRETCSWALYGWRKLRRK